MSVARTLLLTGVVVMAIGCDDEAPAGTVDATVDQGPIEDPDSGPLPDMALPVDMAPPPDMAPPQPAWVELELSPRRAIYALDAEVEISATVYDRVGDVLDMPVTFDVAPDALGQVTDEGILTFSGEGPGTVLACAGQVCGRTAVFVDDGPPVLNVELPERGAILDGEGGRTFVVQGTAVDSAGPVEVRINGRPVVVGEGGQFEAVIPAVFGVNRIEVTADDGVQPDPALDVRDVLWAPRFTPVDPDGVTIAGAVSVRVDQALLDTNNEVGIPEDGGEVRLADLAQLLDGLVQLVELDSLLPDPQIASGEPLDLRIAYVDLGRPIVDMEFTAEGLELYVVMPAVEVETEGALAIEGEEVSLDGSIQAELAAFARIGVGLNDGLEVVVGDVQVNLEGLRGRYASDTANALIDSLGTLLGNIVRDLAQGLVRDLVADQIPALVDAALVTVLDTIANIPLQFDTGIAGVPPLDIALQFTPSALAIERNSMLQMVLDARVQHPGPVEAPHPDPGVPTLSDADWMEIPGEGLGASTRLALLNGLLHEVWRTGLLNISPPLPDELTGVLGEVVLDARTPPVVVPAPLGSAFPLEVQIGDLRMSTQSPIAPAADIYAISLRVGAGIDAGGAGIALELADEPDVEVVLVEQGSDFPLLTPDALGGLMLRVVWPMVQDALGEGLEFGIDPIAVDPAALSAYAPRLQGLTLAPRFREAPRIEAGRLTLEGNIDMRMIVAPAGGVAPEMPEMPEME